MLQFSVNKRLDGGNIQSKNQHKKKAMLVYNSDNSEKEKGGEHASWVFMTLRHQWQTLSIKVYKNT